LSQGVPEKGSSSLNWEKVLARLEVEPEVICLGPR
jgi:hypothetical protein